MKVLDITIVAVGVYFLGISFAVGYLIGFLLLTYAYPWTKTKLNNWALK